MSAQLDFKFDRIFNTPSPFTYTRCRTTDCDTSKAAAKHATTGKASTERLASCLP